MDDLVYRGIIIRQANYGDAHRMLWIFTETDGIIKAVRYGIRGKKTSNAAAFQLFSYADFKLRPSRGDIMTAVSADVIDGFYPVSEDIKKLSLVTYLSDITFSILGEANPDKRILALFLNAVYAAAYRDEMWQKLKTVYELKLMSLGGFLPKLDKCMVCGGAPEYFSCDKGSVVCRLHHSAGDIKLDEVLLSLMRYISACEIKKMLSFNVEDQEVFGRLNEITEKYVRLQCDMEFKSLKYFYAICDM